MAREVAADPVGVVRAAHLAIAAYEAPSALTEWGKGAPLNLELCKATMGYTIAPGEYEVLGVTLQGTDEHEEFHKCQWLAARARDSKVLYVAFRGTDSAVDALIDLSFADVETISGAHVHAGFYAGIQSELNRILREGVLKAVSSGTTQVVFCGHSLGGAYSIAAACELVAHPEWPAGVTGEAITFGAPQVFTTPLRLPAWPAGRAPKLTQFVFGFDLVPRGQAVSLATLQAMVRELPNVAGASVATGVTWAQRFGMDPMEKMSRMLETLNPLRATYVAVGTYVFLQSTLQPTDDDGRVGRRSSCSVFPGTWSPNLDAHKMLGWLPGFDTTVPCPLDCGDTQGRAAMVAGAISDHGISTGYMWALAHLAGGGAARWEDTMKRPPQAADVLLREWNVGASLRLCGTHLPDGVRERLPDYAAQLERIEKELAQLKQRVESAHADAVAKCPPPAESKFGDVYDCSVEAVGKVRRHSRSADDGAASSPTAATNASYIVNGTAMPLQLRFTKQASAGDAAADSWDEEVPPEGAAPMGRASAGDSLEVKLGADGDAVKFVIPTLAKKMQEERDTSSLWGFFGGAQAGKGKERVFVVECSATAGVVVWESVIMTPAGDAAADGPDRDGRRQDRVCVWPRPEALKQLGPPGQGARYLLLHKLAMATGSRGRGLSSVEVCARGTTQKWQADMEKCSLCTADVVTRFAGVGVGLQKDRHHCRHCGLCVCGKCSPNVAWMTQQNGVTSDKQLRVCVRCEDVLRSPLPQMGSSGGTVATRARDAPAAAAPQYVVPPQRGAQPQWQAAPEQPKKSGYAKPKWGW
eukprot:TRINITY_DN32326_c0_g1_i1.p1 TRINITY_DN32326_c0_g1~~TRINITY_DN32326_c0_g1_i1.p1  ORF type:complete len:833 (+),score=205.03 TRINITY_DN32326_c0_g1_i1:69-2501(+)